MCRPALRLIKDWVEKKVRRHLMQARNRQGFGWTRWNRQWIYGTLGLFNSFADRMPRRASQGRQGAC
jgi:RNA-directed DNA polymerase